MDGCLTPSRPRPWSLARRWLKNPRGVASIAPSSPQLADKMAALVPSGPGPVVEIGPGTGAITAGLVRAGLARQVWALEMDPVLVRLFRHAHPGIPVVEGDATQLSLLLAREGVTEIKAIVSSLGLLNMPPAVVDAIADAFAEVLPPGAPWVQYSYGRKPPVPPAVLARGGWKATPHGTVLANLPPARVWTFTRA